MFINRSMFTLILLVIFEVVAQGKFTVNHADINSILKPDQVLTYTVQPQNNNVSMTFKDRDLNIGEIVLTNVQIISNKLRDLKKDSKLTKFSAKLVALNNGAIATHAGAMITGMDEIQLRSSLALGVTSAILRSPKIFLVADHFNLQACFIEGAEFVQLESSSPGALFRIVRFSFSKGNKMPNFIQGIISLDTGKIDGELIVAGVNKIEILLGEQAFKE